MKQTSALVLILAVAVTGCTKGTKPVPVNYYSPTGGPDPYQTQVYKPLEMPKSFAELPTPLASGVNRADMQKRVQVSGQVAITDRAGRDALPSDLVPLSDTKKPSKVGGFFSWIKKKLSR